MTDQPYQVMPPLSADEYAALRDDIAERGFLVPVVKDQHGNILDGHHRVTIAAELGVDYPVEVRKVTDDNEARDVAFTLNLARRHLNREQKRELIAAEITRRPDDSDRAIGRRLACDHKTVGSVRRELSGEIPHPALTPGQRKRAQLLEEIVVSRIRSYAQRIADGEPIVAFPLFNSLEGDDLDVIRAAWPGIVAAANDAFGAPVDVDTC